MKRKLLSGSGIFYKIYNIYFEPNCPERIVAPNCPRRIVLRRIVRAELSCAELSGNREVTGDRERVRQDDDRVGRVGCMDGEEFAKVAYLGCEDWRELLVRDRTLKWMQRTGDAN